MSPLHAVLLGILQGLTEFLPVSSSGHLVLGGAVLGARSPGASFEVFAHAGTLLAILVHYRRDLWAVLVSGARLRRDEPARLGLLLVVATVPAGAVALLLAEPIEGLFETPVLAAVMLLVTGGVLLSTRLASPSEDRVRLPQAVGIGVAQALSLLPGLSRSGLTISTGLHLGVEKERAARFSFLLAVPVLLGATTLKTVDLLREPPTSTLLLNYGLGALAAFVSGAFALRLLLRIVARGHLDRFAWYCLAVGAIALILL